MLTQSTGESRWRGTLSDRLFAGGDIQGFNPGSVGTPIVPREGRGGRPVKSKRSEAASSFDRDPLDGWSRCHAHFKLVWTFMSYGIGMVGEVKMSHFVHFVFLLWFINELREI